MQLGTEMNSFDVEVKRSKVRVTVILDALFQQMHIDRWFATEDH